MKSIENTSLSFLTISEAHNIFQADRDHYVSSMDTYNIQVRIGAGYSKPTDFNQKLIDNTLEFSDQQKSEIRQVWGAIVSRLEQLGMEMQLPDTINFIKLARGIEPGPHTRGATIVLFDSADYTQKYTTIAHELFHVFSKHNPALREALYRLIGFQKARNSVDVSALATQGIHVICNPDTLTPFEHYIMVKDSHGDDMAVMPMMVSQQPIESEARLVNFFDVVEFILLKLVRDVDDTLQVDPDNIELLTGDDVQAFYSKVGKNTDYLAHPEEISADHFSFLITEMRQMPNLELIDGIATVLAKPALPVPILTSFERDEDAPVDMHALEHGNQAANRLSAS